jgi:hypothetical protein
LKTSIIIAATFIVLMVGGCSGTTYLNLSENNNDQVAEAIANYPTDENFGAELTLTLKDSTEITGELLSIRDNIITICEYYSGSDEELAELKYPILPVRKDEIQVLTIKGSNNLWSGMGIGALAGTAFGTVYAAIVAVSEPEDDEDPNPVSTYYMVLVPAGFIIGTLFGTGVGAVTSVEEIILNNIPPGYDLSILKPLARYPDKEPEYLKAIK